MASDIEVGTRLVVDESELESIEDREVNVSAEDGAVTGGTGGGGSGNAAAGGFAGAEAGELLGRGGILVGLLAAILSQLKPATEFLGLIFRVLSLALLPAIQLLVTAVRPLLTSLAKTAVAAENPGRVARGAREQLQQDIQDPSVVGGAVGGFAGGLIPGGTFAGQDVGEAAGNSVEAIQSILNSQKNTADHTDEQQKNILANSVNEVLDLVP